MLSDDTSRGFTAAGDTPLISAQSDGPGLASCSARTSCDSRDPAAAHSLSGMSASAADVSVDRLA